ncbi:MAG: hypothetical protein ABIQ86_08260 [Steroidobacteraceae bacterium]
MSHFLQWLIVLPLVLGAGLFAGWRLITPRLRLRVLSGLLRALPQTSTGVLARWRAAVAQRIAADAASGGACAACSKH